MFREDALSDIVKLNGNYYFIDSCYTMDHGYETMVFSCDSEGNVTDWSDLYAKRYATRAEMVLGHKKTIANLSELL